MNPEVVFELEAPYLGKCQLRAVRLGTGPCQVAIVAGVHGNEVTAIHAANLLIEQLSARPQEALPGILVLPCVNEAGAMLGVKRWPFDDTDLQEVFPGDSQGSAASRLAAAVLQITEAPIGIELQTGSELLEEDVHIRGNDHQAGTLPSVLWWKEAGTSELAFSWRARNQRAIEIRGGRAGSLDHPIAAEIARITLELLLQAPEEQKTDQSHVIHPVELRAETAGFFVPWVEVGQQVQPGMLLGEVRTMIGEGKLIEVYAPISGRIIGVRCYPAVHVRELLVRIG